MIPLFNFKGFSSFDPIDSLNKKEKYSLAFLNSFIITTSFLSISIYVLKFATFSNPFIFWIVVFLITFLFTPLILLMRKSSSIILMLLLIVPFLLIDLYFESNFRNHPIPPFLPPWVYNDNSLIGKYPYLIKVTFIIIVYSFFYAPFCLWVNRIIASVIKNEKYKIGCKKIEHQQNLFRNQWTDEVVNKPDFNFSFWILRIIGLLYFSYFLIILISYLGYSNYPIELVKFLDLTFSNPALTINTITKLALMSTLCFIGAYNKNLRWHVAIILIIGHSISILSSLYYYLSTSINSSSDIYLLSSIIVDTIFVIFFMFVLKQHNKISEVFTSPKNFPEFYSIPHRITRYVYYLISISTACIFILVIYFRNFYSSNDSFGAIYGFPDPQVCNTLTLYGSISIIAFLIAKNENLRNHLFKTLTIPLGITIIVEILYFSVKHLAGNFIITQTRSTEMLQIDWYFVLNIFGNSLILVGIIALRKMFFNVDYSITNLSPSSALSVVSIHGAFYPETTQSDRYSIMQSIDIHSGEIQGRKRGLLNFPFWLVENIFSLICGLRISIASMDDENIRYYLYKYYLQTPVKRKNSLVPFLSEILYKIGIALHALVTMAHYSNPKLRSKTGFVPPDARDRLQSDVAISRPPFKDIAPLPVDEKDENNFKKNKNSNAKFPAPRISALIGESELPNDIDYLIIGSGPAGAVMAYRLASKHGINPEKIAIIERGKRYSALQDYTDVEIDMVRKLYKEGGLQQTKRYDMMILQAECMGGGSEVYNAICFKMPNQVKNIWQNDFDINLFDLDKEYQVIQSELGISEVDPNAINELVEQKFVNGVNGYNNKFNNGLNNVKLEANHANNFGAGMCNIGNRFLRKRTMTETYLAWAEGKGVKIFSGVSAIRFTKENNKASSVLVRSGGAMREIKINKSVIVTAGVIASSHFLMRSKVFGNVGKNVACNYAFPVAFEFNETLNSFDGAQITKGAIDVNSRAIFETYFNPPASFALSLPFYFDRFDNMMNNYNKLINFGALVGSDPSGLIEEKPNIIDGRPIVWNPTMKDKSNIKFALSTLAHIGKEAGAVKAVFPLEPGIDLNLEDDVSINTFIDNLNQYDLEMSDMHLTTAHPQGGNRMCGNNSNQKISRVVDSQFKLEGLDNVFVSDASIFPTGLTVNPQWTILAMSSLASKNI
ncbi:MAG: GMC family oxidoreductase [Chlorobi bacterium]|nr:GMC family oxidoreductase [Chlorobiota bacterium]